MFCKKCGNEVEEGSKWCTSCGFPIGKTVGNITKNKINLKDPKVKKFGIIGVVLLVVIFTMKVINPSPIAVTRNFMNKMIAGDMVGAIEYTNASEITDPMDYAEGLAKVAAKQNRVQQEFTKKIIKLENIELIAKTDKYCKMKVTISMMGIPEVEEIGVIKNNKGKWKIDTKNRSFF